MSKWREAAELFVWHGASLEECCMNCIECEHCKDITVDGKEIMVLCDAEEAEKEEE